MSELAERLQARQTPTAPAARHERGTVEGAYQIRWEADGTANIDIVTADALPADDPDAWVKAITDTGAQPPDIPLGYRIRMVSAKLDPAAWRRDPDDRGKPHTAYTAACWRYGFVIELVPGAQTLPDFTSLMAMARKTRRKKPTPPAQVDRAVVVAWADIQTGKVGSLGGSTELTERVGEKLAALDVYCADAGADLAVLLDPGDSIESFQNTAQQAFTNDLDEPAQVELASDLMFEAVDVLAARHGAVKVAGVGSNHCQWRRGKDRLGKPSADWGLHIIRQMSKAASRNSDAYGHVEFLVPDEWEETLALEVAGHIIGVAHGHQVGRPEQLPKWWKDQSHGAQPVADADILITGHFHHLRVMPVGRSVRTGKARWWFQAPTLDNGSDWFRYRAGEDSDPGLLVFTLTPDGWDDMRIL